MITPTVGTNVAAVYGGKSFLLYPNRKDPRTLFCAHVSYRDDCCCVMTALNGRFALPSTRNNNGQIWVFSGLSRLGTIPCIPCYLHTLPPYFK